MELLPESRVLCIYRDFLVIYAIPEFNSIVDQEDRTPRSPAQPLHTLLFPGPTFAITTASYSPVRVERDGSCIMLICPFEPLYKLTIPRTVHEDPTLTLVLSNFSRHLKSASIGFYRNHAEPRPKEVHRYTLRRESVEDCQEPMTLPAEDYTIYDVRYPFPLLDDISCRAVLAMARNDRFDIFDYVALSQPDSNS
ncbi:hypothetical protein ONZ45_g2937 [Pleurotus djamor]|nr:hypothetical protein ONZ45_g2937 [Pleurotus djamor]